MTPRPASTAEVALRATDARSFACELADFLHEFASRGDAAISRQPPLICCGACWKMDARAWIAGCRSRRFVKKQQVAWTLRGAHLLLQTHTKVLNNELEEVFRRSYPELRPKAA